MVLHVGICRCQRCGLDSVPVGLHVQRFMSLRRRIHSPPFNTTAVRHRWRTRPGLRTASAVEAVGSVRAGSATALTGSLLGNTSACPERRSREGGLDCRDMATTFMLRWGVRQPSQRFVLLAAPLLVACTSSSGVSSIGPQSCEGLPGDSGCAPTTFCQESDGSVVGIRDVDGACSPPTACPSGATMQLSCPGTTAPNSSAQCRSLALVSTTASGYWASPVSVDVG